LINLYALYAFFFISPATLHFLKSNSIKYPFAVDFLSRQRAFYPFVTPNLLANYLVIIISVAAGLLIQARKTHELKRHLFWLSVIVLPLSLFVLFLTKSIGGWLTLLLILFFIAAKTKIIDRKSIILIIITVIAGTLFLIFIRSTTPDKQDKIQFSVTQRLSYWKQTLQIIKQNPLTGRGPGIFHITSTKYAHNSYLQLWAESGIITFIAWLSLCFMFIKQNLKRISRNKQNFDIIAIFSGGMAFLLHNLIDFSFFFPQVSFLWWILLGLTINKQNQSRAISA
jgi:O-antigen ligase